MGGKVTRIYLNVLGKNPDGGGNSQDGERWENEAWQLPPVSPSRRS